MPRPPQIPRRAAAARADPSLATLGVQFTAAFAAGEYARALALATQAWRLSGLPNAEADMALCQMRLGHLQLAYDTYRRVVRRLPTANIYDGLAEAAGRLGLHDEVRNCGSIALRLKDEEARREGGALPIDRMPPAFDPSNAARNAIAFSLFGASPRYGEMAVLNVRAAKTLFPAWTCRFYVDDSVPVRTLERLAQEGALIVHAASVGGADLPGTMWRFLALDDPTLERIQFRDADALLSTRDQAAVEAWCASNRWFHLMRDNATHTELLLAGMWGACTGVLTGIGDRARAYLAGRRVGASHADQHFLRHRVWPTVRQSVLAHDALFDFDGNLPFPPHAPMAVDARYRHVGCNIGAPSMQVRHDAPDGTAVVWTLLDAQGQEVCRYPAVVQRGVYSAALPAPYAAELGAGRWKVVTRTAGLPPSLRTAPAA